MNASHTQQSLAEFIAANELTMDCAWAESNPSMAGDEWSRQASHYLCTIRKGYQSMDVYFSMGSALTGEPTLEMVLDSISSDAASVENAADWADFAEEMGMLGEGAEVARKAQATYEAIERQAADLKVLVGDEAYETLLWNTERL